MLFACLVVFVSKILPLRWFHMKQLKLTVDASQLNKTKYIGPKFSTQLVIINILYFLRHKILRRCVVTFDMKVHILILRIQWIFTQFSCKIASCMSLFLILLSFAWRLSLYSIKVFDITSTKVISILLSFCAQNYLN